jgi:peroxiredoxin
VIIALVVVIALLAVAYTGLSFVPNENMSEETEISEKTENTRSTQAENGGKQTPVGTSIGELAPDFTLTDINGNEFSLSDFRGQVVVLDLMATWCYWCVVEMPELVAFYEDYGDRGVVMISVDVDPTETADDLRSFAERFGAQWIFANDTMEARVGATYQVVGIPTKYVIDQNGIIRWKHTGATSYSTLASVVEELL